MLLYMSVMYSTYRPSFVLCGHSIIGLIICIFQSELRLLIPHHHHIRSYLFILVGIYTLKLWIKSFKNSPKRPIYILRISAFLKISRFTFYKSLLTLGTRALVFTCLLSKRRFTFSNISNI